MPSCDRRKLEFFHIKQRFQANGYTGSYGETNEKRRGPKLYNSDQILVAILTSPESVRALQAYISRSIRDVPRRDCGFALRNGSKCVVVVRERRKRSGAGMLVVVCPNSHAARVNLSYVGIHAPWSLARTHNHLNVV